MSIDGKIISAWAQENNVHKLQTEVRHKNTRSLGNLLKQGYEVVGILHDTAFIDGEWHHEYLLEKILEKQIKYPQQIRTLEKVRFLTFSF